MDRDLADLLYIKALSERLGDDQGVIIHHDGKGYIVYKNTVNKTMGVQENDQFLKYSHGQLVSTGVSKQMPDMEVEGAEDKEEDPMEIYTKVKDGPSFKFKNE